MGEVRLRVEFLETAGAALFVFAIRIIGTGVSTMRILVMARGHEWRTAALGFIETVVYVIALGAVVQNLTDIPIFLAYCFGFSAGTILGMRVERRMVGGFASVRAISPGKASEVAQALRDSGFGATLSWGEGKDGTVGVVQTIVPRKRSKEAVAKVHQVDREAFLVVDEARAVMRGWLNT